MAASYSAVHQALIRKRGRASEHECVHCGEPAVDWAYDHADEQEQLDPGPYSEDLNHYLPLCKSCHLKFDYADRGARTHCIHGHEFTSENTYTHLGRRHCRKCNRLRSHKSKRRRSKA